MGGESGGNGDSSEQESRIDVRDVSDKQYDNATVRTYTHGDGSTTEFSNYGNKSGSRDYVVADKDSSGRETGHTTGHTGGGNMSTNTHGSHTGSKK